MTVLELFQERKITDLHLTAMADENSYWESAVNFITSNWRTNLDNLTKKQLNWVYKIADDLEEKRIEGYFS